MRTLDEVIKNFEICRKARLNLISCDGCTYAIGDNDFCIDCNEIDVLEWLKGYRAHIELDKLRDKYDVTSQKLRNTSQITCPKCHSEFVILPEANNALTWSELKQMEGKPVWIEMNDYKPNWGIVMNQDKRTGRLMLCGYDKVAIRIEINEEGEGTVWQAYRKERS